MLHHASPWCAPDLTCSAAIAVVMASSYVYCGLPLNFFSRKLFASVSLTPTDVAYRSGGGWEVTCLHSHIRRARVYPLSLKPNLTAPGLRT